MVLKSGQIFLPPCLKARVWRTDRILIARPRLHSMQRGKKNELNLAQHAKGDRISVR